MKKWSFATALMLSVAGGTLMTGCIDNDEPYGIQEIRLATADFLKSKKAAADAEAASTAANAEIAKLKAEAEVRFIEAQAAIKEAEAKIKEAQANYNQEQANYVKAQTEAYIARKQAELNEFVALANIGIADAQRVYDEAIYAFEQTKIKNAECASNKLYQAWALAFQAYLDQLATFNDLNKQLLLVQKDHAMFAVDLKYVNGKWESNKYDAQIKLSESIAWLEKQIKKENDKIAVANKVIADYENIKTTDLYKKFEEYQADAKKNADALENAQVELKALAIENKDLYDSRITIATKIKDLKAQEISIPAYSTPAMADVPFFQGENVVIPEEDWKYSLDDVDNNPSYNKYTLSVSRYNNIIYMLEKALMDENDKAWTSAAINEMTRELEAIQKELTGAESEWTLAKKVYNDGKAADASVLPLAAEIDQAIAKYVTEGESISELRQNKINADKAQADAYNAYNKELNAFKGNPASVVNTFNEATKTFNTAYKGAHTAYADALASADKAAVQAKEAAEKVYTATYAAFNIADKNLEAANIELAEDPSNKTLQEKQAAAQKAYDKALADANSADEVKAKAEADAQKAKTKAYNLARAARLKTEADALTAYQAAKKAFNDAGGYDNEKDPAYAPVKEAATAYDNAIAAAEAAKEALDKANAWKVYDAYDAIAAVITEQEKEINYDWNLDEYYDAESDVIAYCDGSIEELPAIIAPALYVDKKQVYYNAKYYLVNKSMVAFGKLGVDYDKYDEYGFYHPDKAFLVDEVTIEMVNEYIHAMSPDTQEYNYWRFYNMFGLYGDSLDLEYKIGMAKAALTNADGINAVLKTLNDNLTAIEEGYENQIAEVKKATEEQTEINNQILNLEQDVTDKIEDLSHWKGMYDGVLSQITEAIEVIENVNMTEPEKQGKIDEILKALVDDEKNTIAGCNNQIEYLNKQLDKAKYQLAQYEGNEDTVLPNPYTIAVEVAQANLTAAQKKLDFLKARADELQKKYEAASKPQA